MATDQQMKLAARILRNAAELDAATLAYVVTRLQEMREIKQA